MPGPFDDVPIVPQVPLVNSNTDAAARDHHDDESALERAIDKRVEKPASKFWLVAGALLLFTGGSRRRRRRR